MAEPALAGTATAGSLTAFAAAHVVADPLADNAPGAPAAVDWDATLAFRRHLWSHGLASPRRWTPPSAGWAWTGPATQELIRRSAAEERSAARIACGAGTDQLTRARRPRRRSHGRVRGAARGRRGRGAQAILMASPRAGRRRDRAPTTTSRSTAACSARRPAGDPALAGPMFDPALDGYWGYADLDAATDVFVEVIATHADKVDGIKVSLLDAPRGRCAAACRKACGCTPATTSTTPS